MRTNLLTEERARRKAGERVIKADRPVSARAVARHLAYEAEIERLLKAADRGRPKGPRCVFAGKVTRVLEAGSTYDHRPRYRYGVRDDRGFDVMYVGAAWTNGEGKSSLAVGQRVVFRASVTGQIEAVIGSPAIFMVARPVIWKEA